MLPCAPGATVQNHPDMKIEVPIVRYMNCKLFAGINRRLDYY